MDEIEKMIIESGDIINNTLHLDERKASSQQKPVENSKEI